VTEEGFILENRIKRFQINTNGQYLSKTVICFKTLPLFRPIPSHLSEKKTQDVVFIFLLDNWCESS
jgi:hypothetical protein